MRVPAPVWFAGGLRLRSEDRMRGRRFRAGITQPAAAVKGAADYETFRYQGLVGDPPIGEAAPPGSRDRFSSARFQAIMATTANGGSPIMCVPGCIETVRRRLSRRGLFHGAGAFAVAGAAAALPRAPLFAAEPRSFSRVVDLTHAMAPDFPTFGGSPNLEMETLVTLEKDGYNMKRWHLVEHTGTHMDAPIHFSKDGQSADEIPAEHLVVPLVIVDIRAKAQENPDAQVTPDDLNAFEAEHGPVPDGGAVSAWQAVVDARRAPAAGARGPACPGRTSAPRRSRAPSTAGSG